MGEATRAIKERDASRPVAIANGDLQYLDLVAELVPNLDVFGSNVYRGASARDLYARVEDELGVPFVYTEFGSDAFNARTGREDGEAQAELLYHQWREIYAQAAGMGEQGNAIGGYVFQWSDGWWKYLQEENLDVHDTHASWPNGGYVFDYVEGRDNMNEEWFGITAKGPVKPDGDFDVFPRPAYYVLQEIFDHSPLVQITTRMKPEHLAVIVGQRGVFLEPGKHKLAQKGRRNQRRRPETKIVQVKYQANFIHADDRLVVIVDLLSPQIEHAAYQFRLVV